MIIGTIGLAARLDPESQKIWENELSVKDQTTLNSESTDNTSDISVSDRFLKFKEFAALLDQGSEISFISEKVAQLLRIPRKPTKVTITSIGAKEAETARISTRAMLRSLVNPQFEIKFEALVLSRLTSKLPAKEIVSIDKRLFTDLQLADPCFLVPDSIDIILGADVYGQLLREGLKTSVDSPLIAQNTALGWIVSGPTNYKSSGWAGAKSPQRITAMHCYVESLDASLQKFWLLEDFLPVGSSLSPEEQFCEKHYSETVERRSDGRYIVSPPVRAGIPSAALDHFVIFPH